MITLHVLHGLNLTFSRLPIPDGNLNLCRHRARSHELLFPTRRHSRKFNLSHHNIFQLRLQCSARSYGVEDSDGLGVSFEVFRKSGIAGIPSDLCFTKTLPSALSASHALEMLGEEVEKLKANPPCSSSGVLRFQVALPPRICCDYKDVVSFPQFVILRQHKPNYSMDGMIKASGIGAAVFLFGSSHGLDVDNLVRRYLSVDSPLIRAYALIGCNYGEQSLSMEDKDGSVYIFIPQIELDSFWSFSLLAFTIVWDHSFSYTFAKAVRHLELCLNQISFSKYCQELPINFMKSQSYLLTAKEIQTEQTQTFSQCYLRLSKSGSVSSSLSSCPRGTMFWTKDCSNINVLWASLIVEECVRLGLTYFCVAPGSRSSPLAISACRHPLTTCISCYDERSLAYHAVGYGKGSHKPAVVITSSGTAVSNLLPSVVEASYAFVPLMLLTADRPPELLETGANQAIDQVNHFGNFVRFFFNLPPPTDQVPARMVLTTIDSAVYNASKEPAGPVHINCPFREPLDNQHAYWSVSCLKGLDLWMSGEGPFTKYIKTEYSLACTVNYDEMAEAIEIIRNANQGLLIVGDIQTEDEIWALILLVKYLSWPVVPDILSGIRLRRKLTSVLDIDERILFLDHLDHVLLSDSVRCWARPDVVVQIGSRITSKRVNQLLEFSSPVSYIVVENHADRHDPSHILSHKIQSTVAEFADALIKANLPRKTSFWNILLRSLDIMVAKEISFQVDFESSLTEPYIAQVVAEVLPADAALFIGNSMPIRDMDMYANGWLRSLTHCSRLMSKWDPKFHGILVAANRGASGIDGLLSAAVGFCLGCNKRVFCIIGDISFLHDTNGLAILSQRMDRMPMTIIVINNHGGAIFSLLPVANTTDFSTLEKYFYTAHDISIEKLCAAHSVRHIEVRTKTELRHALWVSQQEQIDCIIEVQSSIVDNANFHNTLRKFTSHTAEQTLCVLLQSMGIHNGQFYFKIQKMEFSLYRIELCAPPTSTDADIEATRFYHKGFILTILLDDGSSGFGEVAPIEIHKEDLWDAEEQLRFLVQRLEGIQISYELPLLRGCFSHWIWNSLGIPIPSILPSVRCGIEMAVLSALAARQGSHFFDILKGNKGSSRNCGDVQGSGHVQVAALVNCTGSPKQVAHIVSQLADDGFTTIKLKVARRDNPIDDVAVIEEIRQIVGYRVSIRADANRRWTYEEAVQFGNNVNHLDLQYIEEPVCNDGDIIKFCQETGLPVALDETIDNLQGDIHKKLNDFVHPGIVAVVIKPSVVGGFESATTIARWAQHHGKIAVISSAFESSLGLSSYIQFAHYIDHMNAAICKIKDKDTCSSVAHGLGTYQWLKEDTTTKKLNIRLHPSARTVGAFVEEAGGFLQNFIIHEEIVQRIYGREEHGFSHQVIVEGADYSCSIKFLDVGHRTSMLPGLGRIPILVCDHLYLVVNRKRTVVFLHGFLGTSEDWLPIMKALSISSRCLSVDLPGHGETDFHWQRQSGLASSFSIELMADILQNFISHITAGDIILVGYSMGARIALYLALKFSEKIQGVVTISGSPGLRDAAARKIRKIQDEARARYLLSNGLRSFLEKWYAGSLWRSLRDHPRFKQIFDSRLKHRDIHALAKSLSNMSIGKQVSLWEELKHCRKPLLFIVGEKDKKFMDITQKMHDEICQHSEDDRDVQPPQMVVIPYAGHAVHLENPLSVIKTISKFIKKLDQIYSDH